MMNTHKHQRSRVLAAAAAIFSLVAGVLPITAGAESAVARERTDRQVRTCVAEIARNADFDGAARVVYWVTGLEQRNLEELEIRIDTAVFSDDDRPLREYRTACVTDTNGALVAFDFDRRDA